MSHSTRKVLLLSSSRVHGTKYLQYAEKEIIDFLQSSNVTQILFIPYAMKDHDEYTNKIRGAFEDLGYKINGIHKSSDPVEAVCEAEALYVGGGNTFQLLKALYDHQLVEPIRKRVLEDGIPYIGSSAGSNVATISICTTNDMPIVYPPSFNALGLVPFNINPHYIDPDPHSKHMGETREERIKQYHELTDVPPVLGLREGCMVYIQGKEAILKGICGGRLFIQNKEPTECAVGADVSFLLSPF